MYLVIGNKKGGTADIDFCATKKKVGSLCPTMPKQYLVNFFERIFSHR